MPTAKNTGAGAVSVRSPLNGHSGGTRNRYHIVPAQGRLRTPPQSETGAGTPAASDGCGRSSRSSTSITMIAPGWRRYLLLVVDVCDNRISTHQTHSCMRSIARSQWHGRAAAQALPIPIAEQQRAIAFVFYMNIGGVIQRAFAWLAAPLLTISGYHRQAFSGLVLWIVTVSQMAVYVWRLEDRLRCHFRHRNLSSTLPAKPERML